MRQATPFKWRHFEGQIILLCVRRYLRCALSYRDVEEMMRERGVPVDHTPIYRWLRRHGIVNLTGSRSQGSRESNPVSAY